jgi:hypothetical protein
MRLVVEGTHRGELGGSPTGNRIAWGRDHDLSLADGEIAEQSANEDWTALLHAVGHTLRDEVGLGRPTVQRLRRRRSVWQPQKVEQHDQALILQHLIAHEAAAAAIAAQGQEEEPACLVVIEAKKAAAFRGRV